MRLLTVFGTRPQRIKAVPISRALAARDVEEVVLHTGQHHDPALDDAAADVDGTVPAAARHLGVGSVGQAEQVAAIARGVADFAGECGADAVLVVGDTNSALGAALGARHAGVPLMHGEAGVRLGRLSLPEEINRIAADHLAALLLCPTTRAVEAARAERVRGRVVEVGDPLLDILPEADERAAAPEGAILATLHRAENTDDPARLHAILETLDGLGREVVLPLHPRTRARLGDRVPSNPGRLRCIEPLPHAELAALLHAAPVVVTDSGGLQREAYWSAVPCLVLRDDCEWRETIESGWARCVGADPEALRAGTADPPRGAKPPNRAAFGGGEASRRWAEAVVAFLEDPPRS